MIALRSVFTAILLAKNPEDLILTGDFPEIECLGPCFQPGKARTNFQFSMTLFLKFFSMSFERLSVFTFCELMIVIGSFCVTVRFYSHSRKTGL
jgi:hypothetical protein